MEIQKLIGARIKEIRKGLDETQESMTYKADIDKTYWNEVENGKRNVSVQNLGKIVHSLEHCMADFFDHHTFKSLPGGKKPGGRKSRRK
jgi:transcriptional regulator with XRE-family HTH domain